MSPIRYNPSYSDDEPAALPQGGCLTGFILPPLAVLLLGAFMAFILLSASPSVQDVQAANPAQAALDAQMVASDSSNPISYSTGSGRISSIFRPEVLYWSSKILAWAAEAGLDPNLVATVMQIESCGYQKAISRAGAMGLFQVMPYHFASGDDPYDPDTNALRGLAYLQRSLAAANGNVRLALAGYNGGIGVIDNPESTWSSQTQNYVYYGSKIYANASKSNIDSQPASGSGSSICQKAAALEGLSP
jgi:soluble lytic murein transglycosylase-like protein